MYFAQGKDEAPRTPTADDSNGVRFLYDRTKPTLTVTKAGGGTITAGNIVKATSISAAASDGGTGVQFIHLEGPGVDTVGFGSSASFSIGNDGAYTVTAVDAARDANITALSFTVDNTAPAVSWLSPADCTNVAAPTISATVTDATGVNTGAISADVDFQTQAVTVSGNGTSVTVSFTPSSLSQGTHFVHLTVQDTVGNSKTALTTFTLDTQAPSGGLEIRNAAGKLTGFAKGDGQVILRLTTVSDPTPGCGIAAVQFSNNGQTTWGAVADNQGIVSGTEISNPFSGRTINWVVPPSGVKVPRDVWVRYRDGAGNLSTPVKVTVTLDPSAPVVEPGSQKAPGLGVAQFIKTSAFTWSWSPTFVSDPDSGIVSLHFQAINQTENTTALNAPDLPPGTTSKEATGLNDGRIYFAQLRGENGAGDFSAFQGVGLPVLVDLTPPQVTQVTGPGCTNQPTNVPFSWSGTDPAPAGGQPSGLVKFRYQVTKAGVPVVAETDAAMTTSATIPGTLSEGTYTIEVWAEDRAGNVGAKTATTFMVDTTAPEAPVSLAFPAGCTHTGNAILMWTNPAVQACPITRAWYKVDAAPTLANDGTMVDVTGGPTLTVGGLTEGFHTVYVWLEDAAGNKDQTKSASVMVRVDLTAPTYEAVVTRTSGTSFTITGTLRDNQSATVTVAKSEVIDASEGTVRTLESPAPVVTAAGTARPYAWDGTDDAGDAVRDGLYQFRLVLKDDCGNEMTILRDLAIDQIPPGVGVARWDSQADFTGKAAELFSVQALDRYGRVVLASTPQEFVLAEGHPLETGSLGSVGIGQVFTPRIGGVRLTRIEITVGKGVSTFPGFTTPPSETLWRPAIFTWPLPLGFVTDIQGASPSTSEIGSGRTFSFPMKPVLLDVRPYVLTLGAAAPELGDSFFMPLWQISRPGQELTTNTLVRFLERVQVTPSDFLLISAPDPGTVGEYKVFGEQVTGFSTQGRYRSALTSILGPGNVGRRLLRFVTKERVPAGTTLTYNLDGVGPVISGQTLSGTMTSVSWEADLTNQAPSSYKTPEIQDVAILYEAPELLAQPQSPIGGVATGGIPALSWTAVLDPLPGSGIARYELELSPDGLILADGSGGFQTATKFATTDATPSFQPTSPLAVGTYVWHVRAVDFAGNLSAWGPIATFNVLTPGTPAPPQIAPDAILSPSAGAAWAIGSVQNISWEPFKVSGEFLGPTPISLDYSLDDGVSWQPITSGLANTGLTDSFSWTIPNIFSPKARVRMRATNLFQLTAVQVSPAFAIGLPDLLVAAGPYPWRRLDGKLQLTTVVQNQGTLPSPATVLRYELFAGGGSPDITREVSIRALAPNDGVVDQQVFALFSPEILAQTTVNPTGVVAELREDNNSASVGISGGNWVLQLGACRIADIFSEFTLILTGVDLLRGGQVAATLPLPTPREVDLIAAHVNGTRLTLPFTVPTGDYDGIRFRTAGIRALFGAQSVILIPQVSGGQIIPDYAIPVSIPAENARATTVLFDVSTFAQSTGERPEDQQLAVVGELGLLSVTHALVEPSLAVSSTIVTLLPGQSETITATVTNDSTVSKRYRVTAVGNGNVHMEPLTTTMEVAPQQSASALLTVTLSSPQVNVGGQGEIRAQLDFGPGAPVIVTGRAAAVVDVKAVNDQVPPVTRLVLVHDEVHVEAEDPGALGFVSGVASTTVILDSAPARVVTTPFLVPTGTRFITIQSVDRAGNREVAHRHVAFPVTAVRATAGAQTAHLLWTDPVSEGDFTQEYDVERATDVGGQPGTFVGQTPAGDRLSLPRWTDRGLISGTTYWYRILTRRSEITQAGNVGEFTSIPSEPIRAAPVADTTPPGLEDVAVSPSTFTTLTTAPSVRFRLTEAATWQLTVTDLSGTAVRTLVGRGFTDDFGDGQDEGWTVPSGVWTVDHAGYHGYARGAGTDHEELAFTTVDHFGDLVYETTVTVHPRAIPSANLGLIFRVQAPPGAPAGVGPTFYGFELDANDNRLTGLPQFTRLNKIVDGRPQALTVVRSSAVVLDAGRTYAVRVEAMGGTLRGFVDGVLVEEAVDAAPLGPGRVGLRIQTEEGPGAGLFGPVRVLAAGSTLVWDGRSDAGSPVDDGRYTIRLDAADVAGNRTARPLGEVFLDRHPPTAVNDLTADGQPGGAIRLTWSPAMDVGSGVAGYRVLRGTALAMMPDSAQLIAVQSTPGLVDGPSELVHNATYFYVIQPVDGVGQVQTEGNLMASAVSDQIAPAAVTDFQAAFRGPEPGDLTLTWTSPGDDGTVGTLAGRFEVHLSSTLPVTSRVIAVATVTAPGTPVSMVVTGLAAGVTHYALLISVDEVGNPSPPSNPTQAFYVVATSSDGLARIASDNPTLELTVVSTTTAAMLVPIAFSTGLVPVSTIYDIQPDTAPFAPPLILTLDYAIPLPVGVLEGDLEIQQFNHMTGQWVRIPDQTRDVANHRVIARIAVLTSAVAIFGRDRIAPTARLLSPDPDGTGVGRVVTGLVSVTGTVADDRHLTSWEVAVATGLAPGPMGAFTTVLSGGRRITEGLLGVWDTRPFPGWVTVQLSARDGAGNVTRSSAAVFVGDPALVQTLGPTVPGLTKDEKDKDGGAEALEHPEAVAMATDGTRWVADTGADRVLAFRADGMLRLVVGNQDQDDDFHVASDVARVALRLKAPGGLTALANGGAVVADTGQHRLIVLSSAGVVQQVVGRADTKGIPKAGAGPGEFDHPRGVDVDASGNLYVADTENHRFQVLSATGTPLLVVPLPRAPQMDDGDHENGTETGEVTDAEPIGIVRERTGSRVYVSDRVSGQVLIYTVDGGVMLSTAALTGTLGGGPGTFKAPWHLAGTSQGHLYVAERNANRVRKFDRFGSLMLVFGLGPNEANDPASPLRLNQPTGVGVGPGGELAVASRNDDRVKIYDAPSLTPPSSPSAPRAALRRPSADLSYLGPPHDFAIGPNPAQAGAPMSVYFVTGWSNFETDVRVYTSAGEPVSTSGGAGSVDAGAPTRPVPWGSPAYLPGRYALSMAPRNESGGTLASGVYLIQIKVRNPDTGEVVPTLKKVLVIR